MCSRTAINALFAGGRSVVAYPLRAVVNVHDGEGSPEARFMITVPKKKIRTAVGRVFIRRRIREAYRLNRQLLLPRLAECGARIDVAFIYMDVSLADYATIDACMKKLIGKMLAHVETRKEAADAVAD